MRTTISFYPNESKKSRKSNLIPIYLRVLHQQTKREKRLNISIKENELANWNYQIGQLNAKSSSVNSYILKIQDEFNNWNSLNAKDPNKHNAYELIELLTGTKQKQIEKNLLDYFEDYYNNLKEKKTGFTIGTIKNYRKSINHFKKYLILNKLDKIKIDNFSKIHAQKFKEYLLDVKPDNSIALRQVSASSIIMKIKIIFNAACENELIDKNPFSTIKLSNKYEQKPRLNIQELKRIIDLNVEEDKTVSIYKDLFIFCCLTGLAFSDLNSLKRSDLIIDNGNIILDIQRHKTGIKIKQVLPVFACDLINKYKTHFEVLPENRLFPKRCLNNANGKLKIIAAKAQVDKNVSTHTARHTCKQLLSEAQITDTASIYSIMGWSTMGNIELNYTIATISLLIAAKEKFDNYLNDFFNER